MADQTTDQLIKQLTGLRRRIADLEDTLQQIIKGCTSALGWLERETAKGTVLDFQRWSERAVQLKALSVGDIAELSHEEVSRLIRELQVAQIEAKMQNDELRRVHHQLERSRDRYSELYDSAPVGYFTLSQESVVLEANLTAGHLLGRPREALIGTLFSSYVSKDSYRAYYGHVDDVFKTRTKQTCEIQLERSDGTRFPARFDSVAVKDSDGYLTCWRIIVNDITGLKRAEDALRESEELHRITLSSISDTVLISDDDDAFTYICPNVHVIFGYSKEEVQSFGKVDGLLGPDLFDRSEFTRRDEIPNIERTIADKAGNEHVLLINVKRVSIKGGTTLFSCRDITDLRRAEQGLWASQSPTPSG